MTPLFPRSPSLPGRLKASAVLALTQATMAPSVANEPNLRRKAIGSQAEVDAIVDAPPSAARTLERRRGGAARRRCSAVDGTEQAMAPEQLSVLACAPSATRVSATSAAAAPPPGPCTHSASGARSTSTTNLTNAPASALAGGSARAALPVTPLSRATSAGAAPVARTAHLEAVDSPGIGAAVPGRLVPAPAAHASGLDAGQPLRLSSRNLAVHLEGMGQSASEAR